MQMSSVTLRDIPAKAMIIQIWTSYIYYKDKEYKITTLFYNNENSTGYWLIYA